MKIALISSEKLPVPPIRGGAVQQYINGVLPYLRKKHEITILSIQDPELKEMEVVEQVRYIRIPGDTKEKFFKEAARELKLNNYDIVHVFNRPVSLKRYFKASPHSKFILSVHNEMFTPKKIPYTQAVECIKRVSQIVTISDFIQCGILKNFPEAAGKIRTIYSGVDLEQFQPVWSEQAIKIREQVKNEYGINNSNVVLYVSRFSPKKGSHLVLQAMSDVIQENPQTVLLVVGSKWYGSNKVDEYVSYIYKLGQKISGHVIFTGFIPPADIYKYFTVGDIFVCASQWEEPLARVHYEAMAAGLPIITTNRGGNPEVVKGFGNGLVLTGYDYSEDFAAAINYLLRNPNLAREMGRNGRRLAEDRFSYKRVAEDLLRLYEEI
ncbi:glycosyltransferase family 4 protein [Desulfolucanica intricata]|uniref:glycosyltransferase family 4 protein n=1 Tax=Desulfolucanica intricata TaxID=1285191 RepID=UPI00082B60C5|nr:glycosyltransferase family 4 protein [Desulfolucanica intricata]